MRIGNTRDADGVLTALFSNAARLAPGASPQYCPESRTPVWHTDSTYRASPPIGSVLYCRRAPPEGAATCFADARGAYEALEECQRQELDGLECIPRRMRRCATTAAAAWGRQVHSYSPDYPLPTEEQRRANPPRRVPVVLRHPVTGMRALYGVNSSTCAVVPRGEVPQERLDELELSPAEDESVHRILRRELLPFATSERFTVVWQWEAGDLVVWDNRCTMHAATGFDHHRHEREMWRTTIIDRAWRV
ncbi:unnamed protein product [Prorocentrum cordatum]|uniref:TauD/TfdA-like domain-containing protein n=1 Tax=Prorocentrum cordatum TaxID=2364126 RepID=A0ABN9PUD8_9DINO|nr:unnamed protein product [Polarella glacialis]